MSDIDGPVHDSVDPDPTQPGDQVSVLCPDGNRKMKTVSEVNEPDPISHRLFNDTTTYKTDDGKPLGYGMDGVGWFEPDV